MSHRFRNRLGTTFLVGLFSVACGGSEFVGGTGNSETGAGGTSASGGNSSGGGTTGSGGKTDLDGSSGGGRTGDGGSSNGVGGADASLGDSGIGGDSGVIDSGLGGSGGLVVTQYDAGGDCPEKTLWYPDDDNDGYGSNTTATLSCVKPPGAHNWTKTTGDCNDDPKRDGAAVHPQLQPADKYFDTGYPTGIGGVVSFDYDCSGNEEPNPAQAGPPSCSGIVLLTNCKGTGYASAGRNAKGQFAECGSNHLVSCAWDGFSCGLGKATSTNTKFGCR